jgi:hypothetical protein
MTKTTCTSFAALAVIVLGCATAQAAFVEVDTFDSLNVNLTIDGQNGWTADGTTDSSVRVDPADGTNLVLRASGNNHDIFKAISIPNGNTASTLFFRLRRDGTANLSVGTSDVASPGNFPDFESQINIGSGDNDQLFARDAGNFDLIVDPFLDDTWYNIWQVINNSTNTYSVYGEVDGSMTGPTLLMNGPQSSFAFRNGGSNDLLNFYVRSGDSNSQFYVDDVYLDTAGLNLSNPTVAAPAVPEPTTVGMLLLGLGGLSLRRRRSRQR